MASGPCANFFPEFEVNGGECLKALFSGDGSCDFPFTFDFDINLSPDEGNAIVCRPNGLFAAPEVLCYRIDLSAPGFLTTGDECQSCQYIPSGSALEFLPIYLSAPSSGSAVSYEVSTTGGTVISTLTIPAGSNTGTWSNPSYVAPNAMTICGEVVASGTNACGLTVPIQVCDPNSCFADPGEFYDNLDPVRLCAIIAGNCNATLTPNGDGTYTFTANDGSTTTFDVTSSINVCQEVAANCNASLVDNGDGTASFTDNAGVTSTIVLDSPVDINALRSNDACNEIEVLGDGLFVREHTSLEAHRNAGPTLTSSIANINAFPIGTNDFTQVSNYWQVTNPSTCRSMALLMTGGGRIRVLLNQPAHTFSVDDNWIMEVSFNGAPFEPWQVTQVNENGVVHTTHAYGDYDVNTITLAPGASLIVGVKLTLQRQAIPDPGAYQSILYNFPKLGVVGSTI